MVVKERFNVIITFWPNCELDLECLFCRLVKIVREQSRFTILLICSYCQMSSNNNEIIGLFLIAAQPTPGFPTDVLLIPYGVNKLVFWDGLVRISLEVLSHASRWRVASFKIFLMRCLDGFFFDSFLPYGRRDQRQQCCDCFSLCFLWNFSKSFLCVRAKKIKQRYCSDCVMWWRVAYLCVKTSDAGLTA